MKTTTDYARVLADWKAEARSRGREAGTAAASWVIDGNTSQETIRALVRMMDDGDPALFDHLPPMPNLSGEWADELNPARLFEEVTGFDSHAESSWNMEAYRTVTDLLCDEYEEGVRETFEIECERIVRAAFTGEDE